MPVIQQLSPHIANLIAAGEVVERPASVVKELLENSADAGATTITVEIRDGGMTFLRVTDNGCGMEPEDAKIAFLRHATSKLHSAEDLASIATMGFRGEALAAIASVSRIDLLTKPATSLCGTRLHLEGGKITEQDEAGCPDGTTIIIRDLFFNTPARMKFMKSDTVEASRVTAAVQLQALAHPEISIRFLRDGKQILATPGGGDLQAAVYCVYGRECAQMIPVDAKWEDCRLTGFLSKPTDSRPSRSLQTFFVNDRPVRSKLLVSALEEAYRNQIMVGKFPACVLHLHLPNTAVDVNVHPAKTEVKFLNEKNVFDCVHYGCLSALNQAADRPDIRFNQKASPAKNPPQATQAAGGKSFFQTMTAEQYRSFSDGIKNAPQPSQKAVNAALNAFSRRDAEIIRETPIYPRPGHTAAPESVSDSPSSDDKLRNFHPLPEAVNASCSAPSAEAGRCSPVVLPTMREDAPAAPAAPATPALTQQTLPMPEETPWRMVGELYQSYILVEQGDDAFLIDKHAAHERILFDKLKANQEAITGQLLLSPISIPLAPSISGELLANQSMLQSLGFEIEDFGGNAILVRQIPMDLTPDHAAETLESIGDALLSGRHERAETIRDELLHTVACKAAIKAGWVNDEKELLAVVKEVMSREDLKYCPHGRPICISLSKKTLEKQFKRT